MTRGTVSGVRLTVAFGIACLGFASGCSSNTATETPEPAKPSTPPAARTPSSAEGDARCKADDIDATPLSAAASLQPAQPTPPAEPTWKGAQTIDAESLRWATALCPPGGTLNISNRNAKGGRYVQCRNAADEPDGPWITWNWGEQTNWVVYRTGVEVARTTWNDDDLYVIREDQGPDKALSVHYSKGTIASSEVIQGGYFTQETVYDGDAVASVRARRGDCLVTVTYADGAPAAHSCECKEPAP